MGTQKPGFFFKTHALWKTQPRCLRHHRYEPHTLSTKSCSSQITPSAIPSRVTHIFYNINPSHPVSNSFTSDLMSQLYESYDNESPSSILFIRMEFLQQIINRQNIIVRNGKCVKPKYSAPCSSRCLLQILDVLVPV